MKFFISLLAAAAITQAATPVRRQSSPSASVRAAIQSVIDDANALQTQVEGFTGADQLAGVQAAINTLQNDIDSGASLFSTLPALSDTDTLGLADLVNPLETATSDAVDAVIAKKQAIVDACVGPVAYQTFQNLIPSAQTFADNLKALVSDTYKSIIQSASDNIQASLNRGLDAFSDAQQPPASCVTTSTTTPVTTTPTTTVTVTTTETSTTAVTTTTPGNTCECSTTTPPDTTTTTTTTTSYTTTTTEISTTSPVYVTTTPYPDTCSPPVTTGYGGYSRRHAREMH